MRQPMFYNRDKNRYDSQLISSALNDRKDNNTLYGGVTYNTLKSNIGDYLNNNQEYQNRSENPSLTGAIGTYKTIGGYMNGGSGGSGGTPWGAIGSGAKTMYEAVSDKNPSDYSDMEQAIIYPLYGASQGSAAGPWGALGGALYGLGYSFKDDLGLEDNEWYTDLLFPIGMGDEHQGLGISL